jgi:hypothetical protein
VELEGTSIARDQHYTVSELAKRWHLSPNTVRRLVVDEPGVIKLTVGPLLRNRRKRHLVSLRISERVALRVHAKLSGQKNHARIYCPQGMGGTSSRWRYFWHSSRVRLRVTREWASESSRPFPHGSIGESAGLP